MRTGTWSPGRPDYPLLAITALLLGVGLVAVYSASFVIGLANFNDSNYFVVRQSVWAAGGGVLMYIAMHVDYRRYQALAMPLMAATLLALLAVLLLGIDGGGARRWLGVGEFVVQPAEYAKLAIIVYMAAWLTAKGDEVRSFKNGLAPFIVIISTVGVLIMLQPNLGTTLIILVITVTMFWAAGASFLQMLVLGIGGLVSIALLATLEGYRLDRLTAFFNAEGDPLGSGFQTLQALIALGNGGVEGLGLGASRAKFFYIPDSHNDGIYAVIGEEAGIIATSAILLLFVAFMIRGYQIASRSRDQFGMLVAVGITTWITCQAMLNMGGITRVIPLTGVPLPFMSYGGSALSAVLLAVGVLISISRHGDDRGGYMDQNPHAAETQREIRRRRR